MKENNNPLHTYQDIILKTEGELKTVKQKIYHIGTLKLLLFAAGVIGIVYFWSSGWTYALAAFIIPLIPFLYLTKRQNLLFYKKDYLEKKTEINQQEIKAINDDFECFDGGNEFVDPSHLYSYDLDIFGNRSIFQYLNRTSTELGKKRLAAWFNAHLRKKEEIEKRQEAVKELAPEVSMRQEFRILGLLYRGKLADEEEINSWASNPSRYINRRAIRALPVIVPIVNLIFIALAIAGILPSSMAGVVFVGFATCSFIFSKSITKLQTIYGKKLQILGTYARLIRIIESKDVHSNALKEIQNLVGGKQETASQAVHRLTALMNALDQRNNIMMLIILNGLFFWELRQFMKVEAWKEKHASELSSWLKAIGEMDAYCSLATFAYNHPDYIFPEITPTAFAMQAEAMGHPLMQPDKCVCNDMDMEKRPFFIIITGANMAGKSTYLRTVGVNYLLTCIGAPTWARKMKLYPAQLITSIRTSDSLTDNESYFFAELKRLKLIIDKLNTGEELFIILDEILKGTNSTDKQKGSIALIEQFMRLRANGIIATHDLMLGTLINAFPNEIRNYCFEAEITNNELTFSYKMKEGIAQNMNACFLMKKMGIAVIDD